MSAYPLETPEWVDTVFSPAASSRFARTVLASLRLKKAEKDAHYSCNLTSLAVRRMPRARVNAA